MNRRVIDDDDISSFILCSSWIFLPPNNNILFWRWRSPTRPSPFRSYPRGGWAIRPHGTFSTLYHIIGFGPVLWNKCRLVLKTVDDTMMVDMLVDILTCLLCHVSSMKNKRVGRSYSSNIWNSYYMLATPAGFVRLATLKFKGSLLTTALNLLLSTQRLPIMKWTKCLCVVCLHLFDIKLNPSRYIRGVGERLTAGSEEQSPPARQVTLVLSNQAWSLLQPSTILMVLPLAAPTRLQITFQRLHTPHRNTHSLTYSCGMWWRSHQTSHASNEVALLCILARSEQSQASLWLAPVVLSLQLHSLFKSLVKICSWNP